LHKEAKKGGKSSRIAERGEEESGDGGGRLGPPFISNKREPPENEQSFAVAEMGERRGKGFDLFDIQATHSKNFKKRSVPKSYCGLWEEKKPGRKKAINKA